MKRQQDIEQQARQAEQKPALYGADINFAEFSDQQGEAQYLEQPAVQMDAARKRSLEGIGIEVSGAGRSGTFLQTDHAVTHCQVQGNGLEIMSVDEALKCHDWLEEEYWWRAVAPDADKYTARAAVHQEHGYFIRALPGVKVEDPVQACMYISSEEVVQDVHNVIIVEEGAELHVITGCGTDPHVRKGMHIGISEFFVKKGGKLTFTMIHRWGEEVAVRPRTGVIVEEGGTYLSNYICLQRVKDIQMYPTTRLVGRGAVARLNSVIVAPEGAHMDIGGRVILEAPGVRGEIVARTLSTGGIIVNRGHLLGKAPESKAHLECNGLILHPKGVIHAIPELEARTDNAELSHEAAVGKIAPEEIEYLMARGLNEDEATATIVRGFLNVDIEGLPETLVQEIDKAINEFSVNKGM